MATMERPPTRAGYTYAGEAFRAERARLGLSQSQLAAVLDMARNTISRIERNDRPVRTSTLRLLRMLKSGDCRAE